MSGTTTIDSGALTESFLASIVTGITDNLGIVLAFAASVLVFFVLKKWVFGGTRRI